MIDLGSGLRSYDVIKTTPKNTSKVLGGPLIRSRENKLKDIFNRLIQSI